MLTVMEAMESAVHNKRAIVAPATYQTVKQARRSSIQTRSCDKRLKFSETNTEITFDVGSAPKLIRQPDSDNDDELQQYVKCLIAAGSDNIRLKLELLGSRITDQNELDNLFSEPELGFQTLCDTDGLERIDSMSHDEMHAVLNHLLGCVAYMPEDHDIVADQLKKLYQVDLRRAHQRRKEIIDTELAIRGIAPTCKLLDNVKMLRRELKRENELAAQEDETIAGMLDSIQYLTRDECLGKLRQLRRTTTANTLQAVGLRVTGSIQEQEQRLDLFMEVRRRTFILSSAIRPEKISRDELVAELDGRRIRIPYGASDQFLRKILVNALVGEQEKAPIKFPFGVRALLLEDLNNLSPVTIKMMLSRAVGKDAVQDLGTSPDDVEQLQTRLRSAILQQNNDAYVKVIRAMLSECEPAAGATHDDVVASDTDDWTIWFGRLEKRMFVFRDG